MRALRRLAAIVLFAGAGALVAGSGLLQQSAQNVTTNATTTGVTSTVDADGESGPVPADPRPPARALKPSEGLSKAERRQLKARRLYIAAPLTLGPVRIEATGNPGRPRLLITRTAVPASTARTALRAARYAYRDNTNYPIAQRVQDRGKEPGHGPVATAAARAVRDAVAINPARGSTVISLPSVIGVSCTRADRRHHCTVTTIEFFADRSSTAMNTHRRSYRVTVTTRAGHVTARRITAAP